MNGITTQSRREDQGEGAYYAPSSLPSPARGEGRIHLRMDRPLYNYPPLNFTRDFGQECSCPLFSPTATR